MWQYCFKGLIYAGIKDSEGGTSDPFAGGVRGRRSNSPGRRKRDRGLGQIQAPPSLRSAPPSPPSSRARAEQRRGDFGVVLMGIVLAQRQCGDLGFVWKRPDLLWGRLVL